MNKIASKVNRRGRIRLIIRNQILVKLLQRKVIASAVIAIVLFTGTLLYWNFGVNTIALAGVNYTWNGAADSLWSNSANWSPAGIPTSNDHVTIPALARYPVLSGNSALSDLTLNANARLDMNGFSFTISNGFTMYTSSILNVNGNTLTINGSATFSGGTISSSSGNGGILITGNSSVFGNAASGPTFNVPLSVNAATLTLRNTTFNRVTSLTKTGATNDAASGNNVFNDSTFLTNSGTGYIVYSNATRDMYNAPLILNSTNTGVLYLAYNGVNTQFNDNITFNSTSGGIRIGASNGTSTLAAGKILNIGNAGYSSGTLQLSRMTIAGNTDQTIQLSGTAALTLGPSTLFTGNLTASAPGLTLNGATCNGAATLIKTGASNNTGSGNNTFNGATSITNDGTGFMVMANSSRDVFNNTISFTSSNSGIIYIAHTAANTQLNGNVTVNSTSTGSIRFGASGGTATLAAGKTIAVGSGGFNSGSLQLGGITFPSGAYSIALGTNAALTLGPSTSFVNDVITSSGGLNLSGCTFNGKLQARKTGSSNDNGNGSNVFNDSVEVINDGTGYMVMSQSSADVFNATATFSSSGAGIIYVAHNAGNTTFNENVWVNCTGTGGVRFSVSGGTSTLASGKTIQVGSTGFSNGNLMLGAMTMSNTVPQALTTGSNAIVSIGPSAIIPCQLNIEAGGICMNGGVFGGKVNLVKTGASSNSGSGNCTFNDSLNVINSGAGYIVFSNSQRDIYNQPVVLTSTAAGLIYMAHNGGTTEFNDNVWINSTGTSGIRIGAGAGTSTLASGKLIRVGNSGFTGGALTLSRFTQQGNSPQTLIVGAGAVMNLGPALVFNANLTLSGGGLNFNGGTYNGTVAATKTGTTDNAGSGNNVFQSAATFTNSGSGYLLFANSTRDVFNEVAEFVAAGSGIIHVAYNGVLTEFNKDILVNSIGTGGIRFGAGSGTSQLADGMKIRFGTSGFSSGELNLRRFSQLGTTPQSLKLNSGTAALYLNANTVFNAATEFTFPQLFLNGAIFNASVRAEKNGATNNTSSGGNIFNQKAVIKNSGTGSLILSNSSPDDYNGSVSFIQTGSGVLSPANNSACTFSGDISTDSSTTAIVFANAAGGSVTLDGNAAQQVSGHVLFSPTIKRLIVNNSNGGVRLMVPLNVSHSLNLTGGVLFSTATNILNLGATLAAVSNASNTSYVDGPVRKTGNSLFTFPTGKNGYYRPLSITAPTAATEQYTAEYFKLNPDSLYPVSNREPALNAVSRCEYWTLQRNLGGSNVRVSLSWQNPVSCGITAINDLRVARWDALATRWIDLGNTSSSGDVNSGSLQANLPGTPYGVFTLGSSSPANSLPIELISFSATAEGSQALIKWATQSEKNNDYFTIERSPEGGEFTALGTVPGSGNTVMRKDYIFTDKSPLQGRSYYRLKQTDYNGDGETFRAVLLDFGKAARSFALTTAGPNPFINELQVTFTSEKEGSAEFLLYNVQGKVSFREMIEMAQGVNTVNLSILNDLPPGIYFLKMSSGDESIEPLKLIRK